MAQISCCIGTRASLLARTQSEMIGRELEAAGQQIRYEIINTQGDMNLTAPLHEIGSKGVFTKELDEALLAGRIDLAVHSLKDLPTRLPAGLVIAAVSKREDPRDAFVPRVRGMRFEDLAENAAIATSSIRRIAALLHWRSGLRLHNLRGNVDTRLRKLAESKWDGIVLAVAGLTRLGLADQIGSIIPAEILTPAVGQGALALVTRAQDQTLIDLLHKVINDVQTFSAAASERAFLAAVEGGCQIPVGALAVHSGNELQLNACIISTDGSKCIRGEQRAKPEAAETLGAELAKRLLGQGGAEILANIRRHEV